MTTTRTRPADSYSPLYFLASLGAGGLSVTFFMYLMFWVPYSGRPVPVFEDLAAVFAAGPLALQIAVAIAMAGIAVMAFFNIKLLVSEPWRLGAFPPDTGLYRAQVLERRNKPAGGTFGHGHDDQRFVHRRAGLCAGAVERGRISVPLCDAGLSGGRYLGAAPDR
jgi:hypothetical protein